MRILLAGGMLCLLLDTSVTMDAASAACRLFVTAVLPGLFPYMVLSQMLVSRFSQGAPGWMLMLLGWGGGSPTGARLLGMNVEVDRRQQLRLAITTATMSPMFLLGTCGGWLGSPAAGVVLLVSVILGGWLAGCLVSLCTRRGEHCSPVYAHMMQDTPPLPFGAAVEQAEKTMLLVCGTMAMLRIFAALAGEVLHRMGLPGAASLTLTTLLEVTTGAYAIAFLPWPLALRTAVIAGATGFGGMAIIMQNRAVYPQGLVRLPVQILWQVVHGGVSFLLALGMMQLLS